MINKTQKTIPYRLSPAELENLRLLRKRTNPAESIMQDEQEKISKEIEARSPDGLNQTNSNKKGNRP